jgi:hypothetical protein
MTEEGTVVVSAELAEILEPTISWALAQPQLWASSDQLREAVKERDSLRCGLECGEEGAVYLVVHVVYGSHVFRLAAVNLVELIRAP